MSATTHNPIAIKSAVAGPFKLRRLLKIAVACSVLAAGGYAVWSAQAYIVSDNAVVSAYVTALRAPIEGYVSAGRLSVGAAIDPGSVLATVTNPRVDDQRLTELQDRVKRLASERAAIARQRDTLEATRLELIQRGEAYRQATLARLTGEMAATKMSLEAKLSESEQAKRDFARKANLARSGTASLSDLDKAHYLSDALDRQAESLKGQIASVQAQLDAATLGVMTEAGGNDVTYSVQRADEVRLRIADLDRAMDTIVGDAREAAARLDEETRRVDLLRSAAMAAPAAGMLWKVGSSNGERIGVGDMTAELVDCGAAFLVATIPQTAYADVLLGGEAQFRLAGKSRERSGTIISVTGDASLLGDRNLAAVPVDQHRPTAMVRVAVPPSSNVASECLVGRTARVLLPTIGRSVTEEVGRLVRRIF